MLIQPGTDIGRYHILEQLGEGGMAVVYKAYDTRLETEVAIKFIRVDEFGASILPRILKRFQIEARKMAALNHPNIVKVMDYGEYEGGPYLVMPYLPGGTLKEMLGQPMQYQQAAKMLLPISKALAYAHSRELVHRDVKPSNMLITETGDLMLSDFGVAKVLSGEETTSLTMSSMGVGTPEYMAPEQAEGKAVDACADIYALGVVLYELVTGRKPFTADTPMAVLVKHIHDPLPRPSQYVCDLPDEAERVLFKALAKQPQERYQSMDEMTAALREIEWQIKQTPNTENDLNIIEEPQIIKNIHHIDHKERKGFFMPWWTLVGFSALIIGLVIFLISKQPTIPNELSSVNEESAITTEKEESAITAEKEENIYIPVISKGFQHQFWLAVREGAEQAAEDYGVEITYEGPETEAIVDKQMDMLQAAIDKNPAAICFAAVDSKAAIPLLEQAKAKGIPVIGFDSGVDSDIPLSTAATDNVAAAALAADKMAELIGGSGEVAVIVHDQTSRTGIDRVAGFKNRIESSYPGITIVDVQNCYGDPSLSSELAKTIISNNPDLKGFFGANQGSIVGILESVEELGLRGDIVLIGFDSGWQQIEAIRSGLEAGAITQDPIGIGYMCVEAAYKASKGMTLPKFIDTGFFWYDTSNIDDPMITARLYE